MLPKTFPGVTHEQMLKRGFMRGFVKGWPGGWGVSSAPWIYSWQHTDYQDKHAVFFKGVPKLADPLEEDVKYEESGVVSCDSCYRTIPCNSIVAMPCFPDGRFRKICFECCVQCKWCKWMTVFNHQLQGVCYRCVYEYRNRRIEFVEKAGHIDVPIVGSASATVKKVSSKEYLETYFVRNVYLESLPESMPVWMLPPKPIPGYLWGDHKSACAVKPFSGGGVGSSTSTAIPSKTPSLTPAKPTASALSVTPAKPTASASSSFKSPAPSTKVVSIGKWLATSRNK